ncbi:MAG TPA: hypothetical protein VNY27_12435 [Solirubrobacteraceae bacterium]|jgi:hypothetical protein|nr:hypothetical protein [Solirubrobacteraceae bacterium]
MNVSRRAFDAAAHANGASDLSAAGNIAKALKLRWHEVIMVAHEPAGEQNHRLSQKQTAPYQDWLTEEYIGSLLKLVAHRRGVTTLAPDHYREERAAILAADAARWLHGGQLLVPSDDQIIAACGGAAAGGWDRALALAGLQPRPAHGAKRGKYAPPTTDLLDRCYEAHGTQPRQDELETFARANDIPCSRDRSKKWSETITDWKAKRRATGLPVPDGLPPMDQRPDYTRNVGAAMPGETRQHKWDNVEDCIACVQRYLEQLPSGQRSGQRNYNVWAAGQDDAPENSAFKQHGGWEAVRRKALERINAKNAQDVTTPA